jgi:hypothetical protein
MPRAAAVWLLSGAPNRCRMRRAFDTPRRFLVTACYDAKRAVRLSSS